MMQKLMEINDHLVRTLAECEQLRSDQKTLQEICSIRLQRINELQEELRKAYAERDEAVEHARRLQAERDELRKEQSKLQSICADGGRRIAELKAELEATKEEADDAPTEPKKPKKPVKTPAGQSDLVRDVSHYTEAAEVDTPTEPQPEQDGVLVQEGWWLQADGGRVYVRPTNPSPDNIWKTNIGFKWSDGARLYMDDGSHNRNQTTPHDLVKFLGKHVKTQPAEPQPEPQFKPYTFAAYIVGDKIQPDALRIVWATEEWIEQSKFGIVHAMKDVAFLDQDRFTPEQFSLTLMLSK